MRGSQLYDQVRYFLFLVVLQIPMIHRWVLFDYAFPFPYIGFVLLFPKKSGRSMVMLVAFFVGLVMDVFSNTPGMHAAASVFVAYIRLWWLSRVAELEDNQQISFQDMSRTGFILYFIGLLFIHHAFLFILENEGLRIFGPLLLRIISSSLFSFVIIAIVTMLVYRKKQRL
jgi:rod shape-determining protein MreD